MTTILYIPELFGISIEVYFILLILGLPVFFFWRWIFRKRIDRTERRIVIWLYTIISAPILYVLIVGLIVLIWSYHPAKIFQSKEHFNREKWLQYTEVDGPFRDVMVDDLLKTHKLVGLRHSQVIRLLGKPSNYGDSTKTYYQLVVDYDMIDPISGKDLVIKYNRDSIVTEAKVVEWHKGDH